MTARSQRQALLLGGLLVMLVALAWWNLGPSDPAAPPQPGGRRPQTAQRAGPDAPVEAVRLEALKAPRVAPADRTRDPFRFRAAAPPPSERFVPAGGLSGTRTAEGGGEPVLTGPPPIPLRFIGVVRVTEGQRLIAVLSDGNGVYRGSDGDIIEGRYRIVQVRPDSIELAYVDGRGQQVIRLSGS
jgi:hypothetical protein